MATKPELRDRVLRRLKRLALGQSAPADLAQAVENAMDELFAEIRQDGLAFWGPDILDIPSEAIRPFVAMVAGDLAEEFALTPERRAELIQLGGQGERRLRSLARVPVSTDPVRADYF